MLFTKELFIEYIQSLPCDYIEAEEEILPPVESFDLPDLRTGPIYNLMPHKKVTHVAEQKRRILCTIEI